MVTLTNKTTSTPSVTDGFVVNTNNGFVFGNDQAGEIVSEISTRLNGSLFTLAESTTVGVIRAILSSSFATNNVSTRCAIYDSGSNLVVESTTTIWNHETEPIVQDIANSRGLVQVTTKIPDTLLVAGDYYVTMISNATGNTAGLVKAGVGSGVSQIISSFPEVASFSTNTNEYAIWAGYPQQTISGNTTQGSTNTTDNFARETVGNIQTEKDTTLSIIKNIRGIEKKNFLGGAVVSATANLDSAGASAFGLVKASLYQDGVLVKQSPVFEFEGTGSTLPWVFDMGNINVPPCNLFVSIVSDDRDDGEVNISATSTLEKAVVNSMTDDGESPELLSSSLSTEEPEIFITYLPRGLDNFSYEVEWNTPNKTWESYTGTWESYTDKTSLTNI